MESNISEQIKSDLRNVKKYVEGRGIRIDIKNDTLLSNIEQLVEIKLKN